MTSWQKAIKYAAIAFAIFLCFSIIGGIASAAVSGFSYVFAKSESPGEMRDYTISSDITDLKIQIKASALSIKTGEHFKLQSNGKNLDIEEENGLLRITEKNRHLGFYNSDAVLELCLPEGTALNTVQIEAGAGKVTINQLTSGTLSLTFGAGEVNMKHLTATNTSKINGGAGEITVQDGHFKDLDLNMGVGKLNLHAKFTGNCDFDLGIGTSNITLLGNMDEYCIRTKKGIGEITLDGKAVSNNTSTGSGPNNIKINGGIGEIHLRSDTTAKDRNKP